MVTPAKLSWISWSDAHRRKLYRMSPYVRTSPPSLYSRNETCAVVEGVTAAACFRSALVASSIVTGTPGPVGQFAAFRKMHL